MDRFVSTITMRVDAKGRISVPAAFRTILARDGLDALHAYPALDTPALDCGGTRLLQEIDSILALLPPASSELDLAAMHLLGESEALKLDGEGRILLPERFKTHAGIADAASFVGLGYKFQIWAPSRLDAHLQAAKAKVRDLRAMLGSLPRAEAPRGPAARVTE